MQISLKSLRITKYRSCFNTAVNFNRGLNCLVGVNGSGKSNVLFSIGLLKSLGRQDRITRPGSHSATSSLVNATFTYRKKDIHLKAKVFHTTDENNQDKILGSKQAWNLESITGKDLWFDIPLNLLRAHHHIPVVNLKGNKLRYEDITARWYDAPNLKDILPGKTFSVLEEISMFVRGINYYSASLYTNPSQCPVSFYSEGGDSNNSYRIRNSPYFQMIRGIYSIYKYKKQYPSFDLFLNIVGPNGLGLIESIRFDEKKISAPNYEVQSGGMLYRQVAERVLIIPRIKIGKSWLSPNQLSDGTFKSLALVYNLITDNSKLLLLEEPEVCVHYGLLKNIIQILKKYSAKKQIIFSTHSELVLDLLEPENVFIVSNSPKLGTKVRSLPKNLSDNHYKALKTYLAEEGNLGEYIRSSGLDHA